MRTRKGCLVHYCRHVHGHLLTKVSMTDLAFSINALIDCVQFPCTNIGPAVVLAQQQSDEKSPKADNKSGSPRHEWPDKGRARRIRSSLEPRRKIAFRYVRSPLCDRLTLSFHLRSPADCSQL
jgi:hypothetical protein